MQPWVKPDTGKVDWSCAEACAAVTTVLLAKDWNVTGWQLPKGYLVPPLPGRLNHLLWAQDLLQTQSGLSRPVRAIDMGVGANVVYAQLPNTISQSPFLRLCCRFSPCL